MSDHTPRREIMAAHQVDDVARAVLALAREVWVLSDRQVLLEQLLARHGIDTSTLDQNEPDPATQALLDARRDSLIEHVIAALKGG